MYRPSRRILVSSGVIGAALLTMGSSCEGESAADTANRNLSKAAENFEVERRIVGINGITGEALFEVEGYCSIETPDRQLDVICRVEGEPGTKAQDGQVERTTLGLSDNVTFVSTQLKPADVDFYRPRIIFRPESYIPNYDLAAGSGDVGPR